ncbi:tryptophan synthase beta subunit-like PLP-dependent enzyme [Neohortaea acidophila]|uniref:Tryptophan synthase beta subunit-like PLP-dependent enzyme n=1 Tax=Neohortaea acidophila TaxID=245834 RepID=A0A6A6Q656_9PEZI|nr:tryptophan synthase beta subunit-like PLP-dependent enzyme [Neohortaea acidophila]KAF2487446.1 tryptophan synthase beta subunit-like PLP-dependent enzyme [Neohortaea acidophila]
MSYTAKHLSTGAQYQRSSILINPHRQTTATPHDHQKANPDLDSFHRTLPHAGETTLHSLPSLATSLGLSHVFVKDESTRFGLPSFKILGASWAIHRAVCAQLALPTSLSTTDLAAKLQQRNEHNVRLVTCTEGNWGRACARMAKYLAIPITVYVPAFMNEYTRNLIRGEGADVRVLEGGSYDDAIAAVQKDSEATGATMVMDTSWEGYTEFPQWVTEGYSTCLNETDRQIAAQTNNKPATLAIASVGVGSWAHAVASHYTTLNPPTKIITVESEAAPSFKESLHSGHITPLETGDTVMNGMNCGTTSLSAWPVLRDGVYAAVTVTDREAHREVQFLQAQGVNAGPCGAATLAALRKVCAEIDVKEMREAVVVLFSTEGTREYEVPT